MYIPRQGDNNRGDYDEFTRRLTLHWNVSEGLRRIPSNKNHSSRCMLHERIFGMRSNRFKRIRRKLGILEDKRMPQTLQFAGINESTSKGQDPTKTKALQYTFSLNC